MLDEHSRHLLGWIDGTPVAVARWRTESHNGAVVAKLERFAVLKEHRGRGLGRRLISETILDARRAGFTSFLVHAQVHLEALYADFGFATQGDVFDEAGIPHVCMLLVDQGT